MARLSEQYLNLIKVILLIILFLSLLVLQFFLIQLCWNALSPVVGWKTINLTQAALLVALKTLLLGINRSLGYAKSPSLGSNDIG